MLDSAGERRLEWLLKGAEVLTLIFVYCRRNMLKFQFINSNEKKNAERKMMNRKDVE